MCGGVIIFTTLWLTMMYVMMEDWQIQNINGIMLRSRFWSIREQIIKALLAHAQGEIAKHKANVEVYLTNPVGIGEHSNVLEAIEEELNMIAKYQDQIDVIQKYFKSWPRYLRI